MDAFEQLLLRADLDPDSVNRECSDKHIVEISVFLENWELVVSFLGLERIHIEEIKHDSNQGLRLMRFNSLRKWKSLFSSYATYSALIRALLRSGSTDQAFRVCRLLNPNLAQRKFGEVIIVYG